MNLLFDLVATQPNTSGKRHGGGKYGEIIFKRMIERKIVFSCFYDYRKWLNPEIKELCVINDIKLYDIKEKSVSDIITENNIQRLYSALPGTLAKLKCCDIYGTIHGLREFETPFDNIFYRYKTNYKSILKFTIKRCFKKIYFTKKYNDFLNTYINTSFRLITVSEHSKYALLSYFPKLKDKVIPVFYSPNTSRKTKIERISNVEKYFLLVSGNRWEKNNLRAIMAFDQLISNNLITNIRMKVTGATSRNFKYRINNPSYFDFLGYVDDDELEKLYANAYVFVYPSLNEGFGYPPIEAMRYGVPVISSPLSSIAEICSGGALYFNPFSIEEIMNRMMLITEEHIYKEYSKNGLERYSKIYEKQKSDLDALIDYIYK